MTQNLEMNSRFFYLLKGGSIFWFWVIWSKHTPPFFLITECNYKIWTKYMVNSNRQIDKEYRFQNTNKPQDPLA